MLNEGSSLRPFACLDCDGNLGTESSSGISRPRVSDVARTRPSLSHQLARVLHPRGCPGSWCGRGPVPPFICFSHREGALHFQAPRRTSGAGRRREGWGVSGGSGRLQAGPTRGAGRGRRAGAGAARGSCGSSAARPAGGRALAGRGSGRAARLPRNSAVPFP